MPESNYSLNDMVQPLFKPIRVISVIALSSLLASCCLCPEPEKKAQQMTEDISLNDISQLYKSHSSSELPEFGCLQDVKIKKRLFFGFMLQLVQAHNTEIEQTRNTIQQLKNRQQSHALESDKKQSEVTSLTDDQKNWLLRLAKQHRISTPISEAAFFDDLLAAVDVIPPSMALAQAANESAWGTSRFAVQANNLFGQWCFTTGCGLIPQQRPEGATYEVQVFKTPSEAVGQYMLNLNRNQSYTKVRNIRLGYRNQNANISGVATVGGLEHYSARGEAYIEELRQMIRFNKLAQWDDAKNVYPDMSDIPPPKCKNINVASAE